MQKSESIKELAAALAKAQADMAGASKDAKGNFGSYADLASVWEACRGPLSKNGLSVTQLPSTGERGITVTTLLMHTSGEWISDVLTLPLERPTPQAAGSAITYARRYALAAFVGVAPAEDDGDAAEKHQRQQQEQRPAPRQPKPSVKPADKPLDVVAARAAVRQACEHRGLSEAQAEKVHEWFLEQVGGNPTRADYAKLIANIPTEAFDSVLDSILKPQTSKAA